MKTTLKVGDKLYAMVTRHRQIEMLSVEVSKVGSKYIYAGIYKIDNVTLKSGTFTGTIQFYKSEQELRDIEEIRQMRHQVDQKMRGWGFKPTDDQIRAIHKILFPEDDENKPD